MTPKDFERMVRVCAPSQLSAEALGAAIQQFVNEDRTENWHISDCIIWAGQLNTFASKGASKHQTEAVIGLNSAEAQLASREMAAALGPWVHHVRQDLFKSSKAPFRSYRAAVAWMKREAAETKGPTNEARTKAKHLCDGVLEVMRQMGALMQCEVEGPTFRAHTLPYAEGRDGWTHRVVVRRGTRLAQLEAETRRMAHAAGASHAEMIAHVLADVPVILPVTRIRTGWQTVNIPIGGSLQRSTASVEIVTPRAFTPQMMRRAYSRLRADLRLTRRKSLQERHVHLLALIKRQGGVPRERITEFWEGIRQAWNAARPQGGPRYTTWQGPMMAYRALRHRRH